MRLGTWLQHVLVLTIEQGQIAYHQVAPRGRARNFTSKYKARFMRLDGIEYRGHMFVVAPVGPRGGVGLRAQIIGPRLPTPQEAYQAYCNAATDAQYDPNPLHALRNAVRHYTAMALWFRVDPDLSARPAP